MKKGQNQNQSKNKASQALEDIYEIVVETAKQNVQSAMEAWQNIVKSDSLSSAFEVQTRCFSEIAERNADVCRQVCEMGMNSTKNSYEPFMKSMREAFEKFRINPIA